MSSDKKCRERLKQFVFVIVRLEAFAAAGFLQFDVFDSSFCGGFYSFGFQLFFFDDR